MPGDNDAKSPNDREQKHASAASSSQVGTVSIVKFPALKKIQLPNKLIEKLELLSSHPEIQAAIIQFYSQLQAADQFEPIVVKADEKEQKSSSAVAAFVRTGNFSYWDVDETSATAVKKTKKLHCTEIEIEVDITTTDNDRKQVSSKQKQKIWVDEEGNRVQFAPGGDEVVSRIPLKEKPIKIIRKVDHQTLLADAIKQLRIALIKIIDDAELVILEDKIPNTKLVKIVDETLCALAIFAPINEYDPILFTPIKEIPEHERVYTLSGVQYSIHGLIGMHANKNQYNAPIPQNQRNLEDWENLPEYTQHHGGNADYPLMDVNRVYFRALDVLHIIEIAQTNRLKIPRLGFAVINYTKNVSIERLNPKAVFFRSVFNYDMTHAIRYFLENNIVTESGAGVPHYAAVHVNIAIIEGLTLEQCAQRDSKYRTPMYWAIQKDKEEAVEALKKKGIDPHEYDQWGDTIFLTAAYCGDVAMVERCIKYSIDTSAVSTNGKTNRWNAYHYAAVYNHPDFIRELHKHKVPGLMSKDAELKTPLMRAEQKAVREVLQDLYKKTVAQNIVSAVKGFHQDQAAANKSIEINFQFLKEHNIDYNCETDDGINLLYRLYASDCDGNSIERLCARYSLSAVNRNTKHLLTVAMKMKDSATIKILHQRKYFTFQDRNGAGDTHLHVAAELNSAPAVTTLLELKHPYVGNHTKQSPLYYAIAEDAAEAVQAFTNAGYSVNDAIGGMPAPAFLAAQLNEHQLIAKLLKYQADLAAQSGVEKNTPAHTAAGKGHADFIRILHEHKVDVFTPKNSIGDTPLDLAIRLGKKNVIEAYANFDPLFLMRCIHNGHWHWLFNILLVVDANTKLAEFEATAIAEERKLLVGLVDYIETLKPKQQDEIMHAITAQKSKLSDIFCEPLHRFARLGLVDAGRKFMAMMTEVKLSINPVNEMGITPLYTAVKFERSRFVKLLTDEYKMSCADYNSKGDALVHVATRLGDAEMLTILAEHKVDLAQENQAGLKPISIAASLPETNSVKKLMEFKVNVLARNRDGGTALHEAAKKGRKENAEILIAAGADCQTPDHALFTPVYYAAKHKYLEIFNDQKDIINQVNAIGLAPLHAAVHADDMEGMNAILGYAPNLNVKNSIDSSTPMHTAAMQGKVAFLRRLCESGADLCTLDDNKHMPIEVAFAYNKIEAIGCFASRPNLFQQLIHLNRYDIVVKVLLKLPANFIFSEADRKLLSEKHVNLIDAFQQYVKSLESEASEPTAIRALQKNIVLSVLRDPPENSLGVIFHIDPNKYKAWISSPIDIIRAKFQSLFNEPAPRVMPRVAPSAKK